MPVKQYINSLTLISLVYLFIPFAIFLIGWIKPVMALPLVIAGGWFLWRASLSDVKVKLVTGKTGVELCIVIIIAAWVLLSGIGGFMWQNTWDHSFRNALFADLVANDWPVVRDGATMVYYIGFWLPCALIAKLTTSLTVGYLAQFAYALIGLLIAFRLTSQLIGSASIKALFVFILFSGLDIVGAYWIDFPIFPFGVHFGHWNQLAMWEGNTTLLFWVYNQAVPAWVGTMLIFSNRAQPSICILALCFMSISSPFPCVGIISICTYYLINRQLQMGGVSSTLKFYSGRQTYIQL